MRVNNSNAKDTDEALKSFQRALELDANDGVTWSNVGQIYLELDKLDSTVRLMFSSKVLRLVK